MSIEKVKAYFSQNIPSKAYMKISPLKVGGRTIKTVIAVFLCFLVDTVRSSNTAFYAAITAILCIQRTPKDAISTKVSEFWHFHPLLFYVCGPQHSG